MSNDVNNKTNSTMPDAPTLRQSTLTPALQASVGADTGGSLLGGNIPILLVGVALVVYFIMRGRSGILSPFDQLKPNSKNAIDNFLQFQNMIQFTLDNNVTQFSVSHYLINNVQSGIVLANLTQSIYISYNEYLNWYNKGGSTLFIPTRTLSNNTLTDSNIAGYSLYYDTVVDVLKITSLAAATNPSVQYTDANNVTQTVPTTFEPDIQITTAGATAYTEFIDINKLGLSQDESSALAFGEAMFSNVLMSYNSGTQVSPSDTNIPLQFSELIINGAKCGYQFISQDQSVKIYMTYRELLNTSDKLPIRSIINNTVINDLSDGYVVLPNTTSTPGLTFYRFSAKIPASYVRTKNVPNLNIDPRGPNYAFYITYGMLGIDNETIINTFVSRQDLIQYKFNDNMVTLTAEHILLNNVQSGVKLSNANENLTIYLSYNELLNWLLSDFTSPGANASIIVPQRSVGSSTINGSSIEVVTDSQDTQCMLAFDPNNNAQINITSDTNTIINSLVQYTDTTQATPVSVILDANTGWKTT